MKNLALLLSFFFVVACNVNSQSGALPVADFGKKMEEPKVQVLDVRTAGEYQSGHLKNALQADWMNKEQFADRTQYLDKSLPVLIYCASGVRSGQAMQALQQQGFKQVYNLDGGMSSWKMNNLPVVAENTPTELSLEAFETMVNGAKIALVDIGAEWCPPCKKMEPVLQALQKDLPNTYTLVKIDGGNDIAVMKALNFVALPTFIIFKNGKETWRKQGVVSYDELKTALLK